MKKASKVEQHCLNKDCPERTGGKCSFKLPPEDEELFMLEMIRIAAEQSNAIQRKTYFKVLDKEKAELREVVEFLIESNAIESETSLEALSDSLKAWEAIMDCGIENEWDIKDYHGFIMRNLRPDIAGNYRRCSVSVGGRICPPWQEVEGLLTFWFAEYGRAKTEEKIKEAHVEFEKIHAFEDGNGRTGRLIMNWQRVKAGLPLLIIHTGDETLEYYKWFK